MKKKRKKYIKIAVEVVAFILFIAVLGYGLQYVDNKTEKANVSDESSIIGRFRFQEERLNLMEINTNITMILRIIC